MSNETITLPSGLTIEITGSVDGEYAAVCIDIDVKRDGKQVAHFGRFDLDQKVRPENRAAILVACDRVTAATKLSPEYLDRLARDNAIDSRDAEYAEHVKSVLSAGNP